jgi:Protein of unknown function (DUF4238)
MMTMQRNRRDHYIPQGYLRGFIDPNREDAEQPLWVFDVPTRAWSEKSPRQVGCSDGFYDYTSDADGVEDADKAFVHFENKFPGVIKALAGNKFTGWKDHLDFFLHYMQMMRSRSPLFIAQQRQQAEEMRGWVVKEVINPTTVTVHSMEAGPLPENFIANRALAEMQSEIAKGPGWLKEFKWMLKLCESPRSPFIISELPFVAVGPHPRLNDSFQDPTFFLVFPLCWQACLVGSRLTSEPEIEVLDENRLREVRRMYMQNAEAFVVSPRRLDD